MGGRAGRSFHAIIECRQLRGPFNLGNGEFNFWANVPALMHQAMNRNADPGQSIAYLAMAGAKRSTGGDATLTAVPPLQAASPREWLPAQIKTKETEAPQIYGAPIHKRLELEVMEPPLSPTTAQRAARRAAKGPGVTLSLTPAKRPVRVEWCMQPQVELPSITAHKSGAFSVTSTPLEEVPTAGQVDDCILAEHYTPCGVLRATAPHAASQLHVHKLSSMLVMVKTVRLGELHTARQRHRAVTEWRLLRALYAAEGSNSSCQAQGSSNSRLVGLATHTFEPYLGQAAQAHRAAGACDARHRH